MSPPPGLQSKSVLVLGVTCNVTRLESFLYVIFLALRTLEVLLSVVPGLALSLLEEDIFWFHARSCFMIFFFCMNAETVEL